MVLLLCILMLYPGRNVAILDFSFNGETMKELIRRANSVVVLDHHVSAKENLASLPDKNKVCKKKEILDNQMF